MTVDFSSARWRKSSRSGDHIETECVEVADLVPMVGVRDSKHPDGPKLTFSRQVFRDLSHRAKTGELDL
jgi:Domain of unknown function (DUF397)